MYALGAHTGVKHISQTVRLTFQMSTASNVFRKQRLMSNTSTFDEIGLCASQTTPIYQRVKGIHFFFFLHPVVIKAHKKLTPPPLL